LNGNVIKKVFKPVIIPSEMEIMNIPSELLGDGKGELSVSLVQKEEN
jgi:hypothetical protein